jgi:hypothetical protein
MPAPPDRSFWLDLKIDPDNPNLLTGLENWLELGLIDDRQIRELAALSTEGMGAPAKPFRMALGALIIKEKLKASDRETVEQIRENPYLQYFIGMEKYSNKEPF